MFNVQSPSFLRRVLLADAITGVATGLMLVFGADALESLLAIPAALLQSAGIVLLPLAGLIALLATRAQPPRIAVWAVIACNAMWTIDSFVLLLSGWIAPNSLGQGFIVLQAVVVAVFAELEYFALRKNAAVAAC
ncbi:hypothetical protein [Noviherbaspirillum saxi]|uniref:Uncharacterized protein n=1 Tax=Noviherbaspirillum saxi TaxID=2320863 RepID=A0A3A3FVU0_9BURK|nr:hypothetical protein [Noviherbaspirillum saxi]RJF99873.1 hypothetical protein D3871_01640 [Noviherbaspirillum saxi]